MADRSPLRRFVVIGRSATASGAFLLDDVPGTSGRIDVLVRCIRPALLVSHGIREDVVVYLVLLGGPSAPRTLRIEGAYAEFLRPDERNSAVLVQKMLTRNVERDEPGRFFTHRPGIAVARGGLDTVLADIGDTPRFVLDAAGEDVRRADLPVATSGAAFFVGDHTGFDDEARTALAGARALSLGPVVLQAEDAIAVLSNELDRRRANA